MTAEDEQKAMLADDLSAYIKDKHTQEECVGFIDGYNAALTKLKLLGIADIVDSEEGTESDCDCKKYPHVYSYDNKPCCKNCGREWVAS